MKLRPILLFVLLASSYVHLLSQDYEISFMILGQTDHPDSVFVENLDQDSSIILLGSNILQLFDPTVGMEALPLEQHRLRCYPNPFENQTIVEISGPQQSEVNLKLCDLSGRVLISQIRSLEHGSSNFVLSGLGEGNYVFSVSGQDRQSSLLIQSHLAPGGFPELNPIGLVNPGPVQKTVTKSAEQVSDIIQMPYIRGEVLEFTAYRNQEASNVESLIPDASRTLEFSFPPAPVVDFGTHDTWVISGDPVHFADSTENGPTEWSWDFGDGTGSTEQHPVHSYDSAGSYTVKLTAINDYGSATRSRIGYITVSANNIVYGIKHGEVYGYINASGEVLLDSLEDGWIGALEGGKSYMAYTTTDDSVFPPVPEFSWKRYRADGTVVDFAGDYALPGPSIFYTKMNGLYAFIDEMAIVSRNNDRYLVLYGFVDENHQEIIPCRYKWVSNFHNGLAAVIDTVSNKLGFIDKSGNYAIPPQYDYSPENYRYGFHNGLAVVSKNGIPCVIDIDNNLVTDLEKLKIGYDEIYIEPAEKVSEGLLRISTNLGTGYANLSGEWEIAPNAVFSNSSTDFVNGYARVSQDGKYSYIDPSGNLAFPGEFYSAGSFDENHLAWVVDSTISIRKSKASFINESGERAFPVVFNGNPYCHFVNGYALVKDWDLNDWIYINTSGETVLVPPGRPYIFTQGSSEKLTHGHFNTEGVALIIFDDYTYGYINLAGEILWKSEESYNEIETKLWRN